MCSFLLFLFFCRSQLYGRAKRMTHYLTLSRLLSLLFKGFFKWECCDRLDLIIILQTWSVLIIDLFSHVYFCKVLCKSLKSTVISLSFARKMGSIFSYLLKYVQIYMEMQHVRQTQSLYNSNKVQSQHLVCPPLFFNRAWTLL